MKIMGIINVTPDSFSDGGRHYSLEAALAAADQMVAEGVDIIDIGGESTRPFSQQITIAEELQRILPVIEGIRRRHSVSLSIDTTKSEVARQALGAGADIINDISALRKDPLMLELIRSTSVPLVIMHMKGTPETMQIEPQYDNVVEEVVIFFRERLHWLESNGVDLNRVIVDPGIGFGKTREHNLSLLKHLDRLKSLGQSVLLGHSRKRFIGDITNRELEERDVATAVISALAVSRGVDIVRVHNVAATRDAIRITRAIASAH